MQNVPLLTFSAFCCPCLDFFDVCCHLQIQNQFIYSQFKPLILFLCSIVNKIWLYMIRVSPAWKPHVLFSDLLIFLSNPFFHFSLVPLSAEQLQANRAAQKAVGELDTVLEWLEALGPKTQRNWAALYKCSNLSFVACCISMFSLEITWYLVGFFYYPFCIH